MRIPPRTASAPAFVTREPSSYLGYPLIISKAEVLVFTPAGRRMCSASSVKQARLLVRAYRRESSRESRVVSDLAERALGV